MRQRGVNVVCTGRFRPEAGSSVLGKIEPHLAVALGVLPPALAYLDEQKEMHGHAHHFGDFAPGQASDLLDGPAMGAEHDLSLAFAHHVDRLLDTDALVLELLPVGGLDG